MQKMDVFGFGDAAGHLRQSVKHGFKLSMQGREQYKVEFDFLVYGRFVDMGVGREFFRGNSGKVDYVKAQRLPKEWFSAVWWRHYSRLIEIANEKFSTASHWAIIEPLASVAGNARSLREFYYKS